MKLTENFTKEEFEKSSTASKLGIDNKIPEEYLVNVFNLAKVLQVIREAWKAPIIISSGYRCEKLNRAVKGASNSDHKFAAAADIHTKSNTRADNKKLFDLILSLANAGKIKCRQIIDEYNFKWVHVSVNHKLNSQKNNQVVHVK